MKMTLHDRGPEPAYSFSAGMRLSHRRLDLLIAHDRLGNPLGGRLSFGANARL